MTAEPAPHAGALDRLCRLACAVAGAPAALVLDCDEGRTTAAGHHGCGGAAGAAALAARLSSALARPAPPGPDELHPVAAIPLHDAEGAVIGTLVVLDHAPHEWTAGERERLDDAAAAAAAELAWRRIERERAGAERERDELFRRERQARSDAQAAERRSAFLAEAGTLLDASLDYHDTFQKLARLAVPTLADYCLIDEALPDGGLRRIARAHVNPAKEVYLYSRMDHPPDDDLDRHPVLRAIRSGLAVLVPEFTDLDTLAHDDDHRARLSALALRSYIVAPLVARGRVLGTITLAAAEESERRYRPADVTLAEELARRAAVAIDNARLYTQAQQAIRARDAVLAVVSHDLRNPLSSILLNATMALDFGGASLDPWLAETLRQVVGSVEETNRLIGDLLDVARLENGGLSLDRVAVDGRALVRRAVAMLSPIAQERGVALVHEDGAGPVPVLADADRVVQVLSNLIGNAVKFTPRGGSVRVAAAPGAGEHRFVVEDTGVGIPEDHLPHVFDRFWQVGRADRRGVGLGLPIARGLVEAHGGRVWIDSRPGAGTAVHFTLPSADGWHA